MKKVLLGTTALLAASMMSGTALGQARTAMTSTNFNLTLGGFTTFRFEYQNTGPAIDITTQDADGTLTAQPRNHNLDFDAELEFRGAATLSNGVKAGWEVELEAGGTELDDLVDDADPTDADIIDDNYMYLDGRLGKVTLGSVAPTNLAIAAPTTYSSAGGINLNDDDGNALAVAGTNRANLSNGITTRWDFGVSYTGLGGGKTILVGIRQEKWEDDMNNPDNESKTRSIDVQHNWDVAPGFEFDIGYTNYIGNRRNSMRIRGIKISKSKGITCHGTDYRIANIITIIFIHSCGSRTWIS